MLDILLFTGLKDLVLLRKPATNLDKKVYLQSSDSKCFDFSQYFALFALALSLSFKIIASFA